MLEVILGSAPLSPLFLPAAELPSRGRSQLGTSRQGRSLYGWRFGNGPIRVSLIAGCHADEPVGPAMLERLVCRLASLPEDSTQLTRLSWSIVPHANPDGDAANAGWRDALLASPTDPDAEELQRGYDLDAYLNGAVRELPGDDVEFGFPRTQDDAQARPENLAIAQFLRDGAPYHLHVSFHGMAFAHGPWFLIDATWAGIENVDPPGADRTQVLRQGLAATTAKLGYRLHDVDRGGEKGFFRIEKGFCTRPDSRAMRAYFEARNEPEMAARFRPSSMEFVRTLGGDPLTLVSEMPLFLLPDPASDDGRTLPDPTGTERMVRFRIWLQEQRSQAANADAFRSELARHGIVPMPISDQMSLQLALFEQGLRAVAMARG